MSIQERIKKVRTDMELTQEQFAALIGLKRNNYAQIEAGKQLPTLDTLSAIVKKSNRSYAWIIDGREEKLPVQKKPGHDVQGNVQGSVQAMVAEPEESYTKSLYTPGKGERKSGRSERNSEHVREHFIDSSGLSIVPVVDIRAAAGDGYLNAEYLDENQVIRMPEAMIKKGHNLCIRVKGHSMAPTIMDGGLLLVHLLDRSEWGGMRNGYVHVIVDHEGHTLVKRIKNRLNGADGGFIVCMSDNPDKMAHPNFNLTPNEIQHIWEVTWYMTAKMPNVQETLDSRLADLEDGQDELRAQVQKLLKVISK